MHTNGQDSSDSQPGGAAPVRFRGLTITWSADRKRRRHREMKKAIKDKNSLKSQIEENAFHRKNPLPGENVLRRNDSKIRDRWTNITNYHDEYFLRLQLNDQGAFYYYIPISKGLAEYLLSIKDEDIYSDHACRLIYTKHLSKCVARLHSLSHKIS